MDDDPAPTPRDVSGVNRDNEQTLRTHTPDTVPSHKPEALAGQKRSTGPVDGAEPRRRPRYAPEDRERSRRMLGVLKSTLSQASGPKRSRRDPGERPRVPSRPVEMSHAAERQRHDEARAAVRRDVGTVRHLAGRLSELELVHKTARSHARRLSSFLVTHTGDVPLPPRSDPATQLAISAAYNAAIPLVHRRGAHEVYYLPRTLLPEQEDMLDAQEEQTDAALDVADDDWERERTKIQAELDAAKRRLEEHGIQW